MRTVWEYHYTKQPDEPLPTGALLVHAHAPYAGKTRVTVVTAEKPSGHEARQIHVYFMEEIEPVWYVIESAKVTFRLIQRCRYCHKYTNTTIEPIMGDRYLIKPKFNAAQWSRTYVQATFPEHLQKYDMLLIEYRPAEPDEDYVKVDLNGRELKLAVIRSPLMEERYIHRSCTIREELIQLGEEHYLVLDEYSTRGGRFYYYPLKENTGQYITAGQVHHAPGTWEFLKDLSAFKKYHSKFQVFKFMYNNQAFIGFFN